MLDCWYLWCQVLGFNHSFWGHFSRFIIIIAHLESLRRATGGDHPAKAPIVRASDTKILMNWSWVQCMFPWVEQWREKRDHCTDKAWSIKKGANPSQTQDHPKITALPVNSSPVDHFSSRPTMYNVPLYHYYKMTSKPLKKHKGT